MLKQVPGESGEVHISNNGSSRSFGELLGDRMRCIEGTEEESQTIGSGRLKHKGSYRVEEESRTVGNG